ncbi:MAG: PDZ domain-containing protein [Candidatus Aminicenantes bacterium]|nr:PDZ domain-containing protein [Candidatus Aminicenantes bacterium]
MKILKKNLHGRTHLVLLTFLLIFAVITVQSYAGKAEGKGFLGVNIEKLSGDDREEFGVKFGVLVTGVTKDEAAFKAGLKKYDVIQYVGDTKTRRPDDLVDVVSSKAPGTKVKVKFVRDGKNMSVSVVLGKRKMNEFFFKQGANEFRILGDKFRGKLSGLKELKELKKLKGLKEWKMKKRAYLGVEMRTMDDNFSKYFGVKKGGGALIMNVTKDSAASKAGLMSGDVILKIEGLTIKGPGDVSKAIHEKKKGDKIKIKIFRHKKVKNITAELGERSFPGAMFFGGKGLHFGDHDIHIRIPEIVNKVRVWRDADGNLHKEKLHLIKEHTKMKKEMMKKKEEIKKHKKLKEKELQEKLKVIEEEKAKEIFI